MLNRMYRLRTNGLSGCLSIPNGAFKAGTFHSAERRSQSVTLSTIKYNAASIALEGIIAPSLVLQAQKILWLLLLVTNVELPSSANQDKVCESNLG